VTNYYKIGYGIMIVYTATVIKMKD